MTKWRILLAAFCLYFSVAQASERNIVVLPLKYSLPEQVLPTVQAILPEGATVTAHGSQLIIKVTSEEKKQY